MMTTEESDIVWLDTLEVSMITGCIQIHGLQEHRLCFLVQSITLLVIMLSNALTLLLLLSKLPGAMIYQMMKRNSTLN